MHSVDGTDTQKQKQQYCYKHARTDCCYNYQMSGELKRNEKQKQSKVPKIIQIAILLPRCVDDNYFCNILVSKLLLDFLQWSFVVKRSSA